MKLKKLLTKENQFKNNYIWIEPCAGADTPEQRQLAIKETNAVLKRLYGDQEWVGEFHYEEEPEHFNCRLVYATNNDIIGCPDGGHYFCIKPSMFLDSE